MTKAKWTISLFFSIVIATMGVAATGYLLPANAQQGNQTDTMSANATEGAEPQTTDNESSQTVVRDSSSILLEGKSIPPNDFIHLYDSSPYAIMNGHIAAKLPCGDNSTAEVNILTGQAPNLKAAELENIKELSTPGELCLYHVDIQSDLADSTGNSTITDIALQNPSDSDIEFGPSSTVVIGVNAIAPLP
jgi:hypothetical protein